MSTLVSGVRRGRPAAALAASVREVCLLGTSRTAPPWTSGERVTVSGRAYRVAATQDALGRRSDDAAPRYIHLVAEVEFEA